jgi:internalin A
MKIMNEISSISIRPVISYPNEAQVGKTFLISIDLEHNSVSWPYPEEEYDFNCVIKSSHIFNIQVVGKPTITLHRFGGSYNPACFLLTPLMESKKPEISISIINPWGIVVRRIKLSRIRVGSYADVKITAQEQIVKYVKLQEKDRKFVFYVDLSFQNLKVLPRELFDLDGLISLKARSNKLTSIPPQISKLESLNNLDLGNNQIRFIPNGIGRLLGLKKIDFGDNRILSLPHELLNLPLLEELRLDRNPLPIPPDILSNSEDVEGILNYYFQALANNNSAEMFYEVKLIIVGEGGAGKTSLAKKIQDENYELDSNEISTKGFEVSRWEFDFQKDIPFQVNIWDFGGQAIYHATYQFFLTKRSLYILVVDTREDNTDLYYWLNIVRLLSNDSPVLIVKNEKQDRPCRINERQLRQEFSNLKEILKTNLKTNRGLHDIKATIQRNIYALPHISQSLPKKWINVCKALENDPRNYISFDEYRQLCEAHNFQQRQEQLQLSDYLHDLGVCLHFQADPLLKKVLILNLGWATIAVHKVFDTLEVEGNRGVFNRTQLSTIWDEHQYASMQDELLQLMMNFKLCYQIPGTQDEYIVPQLLDDNPPDYAWDGSNNLMLRYHYEFMPKGILARLIVETHRFIEAQTLVWKSGVVLTNGTARSEVIELKHNREIRLRVSGIRPKELLTVITHEIDKINNSFDRIQVQKLVPCNCSVCMDSQDPCFYPLEKLHERLITGKKTIECSKPPYEDVLVQGLIDETHQPVSDLRSESWPTQTEESPTTKKIPKVFISYAHEDEQFKDRIDKIMAGMKRRGIIDTWQDRSVSPGDDWYEEVQTAMNEADIAILLISADFIESRFIKEGVPRLLERRKKEGMQVIPIIVRPCMWTREPMFRDLQTLPKDGKPVTTFAQENGDPDQAWLDVAKEIENLARNMQ